MAASVFEHLYQEEIYLLPEQVIVVLDKEWSEHSEDEKTLLQKILGSVRLTPATVKIVVAAVSSVRDLLPHKPSRIISFGVALQGVSGLYQFSNLEGVPIICADSLARLDDVRKKSLWQALRQMFDLR